MSANGKKAREILGDPENLKCLCTDEGCEWRGKCRECVALHRSYGTVPCCLGKGDSARERREFSPENLYNRLKHDIEG